MWVHKKSASMYIFHILIYKHVHLFIVKKGVTHKQIETQVYGQNSKNYYHWNVIYLFSRTFCNNFKINSEREEKTWKYLVKLDITNSYFYPKNVYMSKSGINITRHILISCSHDVYYGVLAYERLICIWLKFAWKSFS